MLGFHLHLRVGVQVACMAVRNQLRDRRIGVSHESGGHLPSEHTSSK